MAHGEFRVVALHGADAREHGAGPGAQRVHVPPRLLSGDPPACAVGERDAAIQRCRRLDAHPRPSARHAREIPAMGFRRCRREEARFHLHARGAQARVTLPAHERVGILESGDHAAHARGDERVGARRRPAMVAAGFEGHVGRRACRGFGAGRQRLRLGVRFARTLVPALADDPPGLRDHAAHAGIGRGGVAPVGGEGDGARHQGMVRGGEVHPTCPAPRGWRRGSPRRPRSCDTRRRSGCRPPCPACAAPPSPSRPGAANRPRARPGRAASARCA